jgi:MYXO-CTERM domain-containing protein
MPNRLVWAAIAAAALSFATNASAQCGDGALTGTEACDDGNARNADGCSSTCTVESGFVCTEQVRIPLINASFETPIGTTGPGWILTTGNIDVVSRTADGGCWPSGHLDFSVDLNGSTRGEIYQDVATVPGTRYVMTMLGNANCRETGGDPCNRSCSKVLTISAADASNPTAPHVTTTYSLRGSPQVQPWRTVRFEFVANATLTRIRLSGSDPSAAGPMIDHAAIPTSVCVPNTCGNGAIDTGELCDDGNNRSGDGCSADCRFIEQGWTCPPGSACTGICGDGVVVSAEACDDGGNAGGDGCSATCAIEPGWSCIIDPLNTRSVCARTCGDLTRQPGESCDDGNTTPGDGCGATCAEEPGWTCPTSGACAPLCGDGVVLGAEQCDDGDTSGGDGCSAACAVESGWTCGCAAPVFSYSGEALAGRLGGEGGAPGPQMGCEGSNVLIGLALEWSILRGEAVRTRTICGSFSVDATGAVTTTRTTVQESGGSGCAGWSPGTWSPEVLCPNGWGIVGLRGLRSTLEGTPTLFQDATIVCQQMAPDGQPIGPTMELRVTGGGGFGTAQTITCPSGTIARWFQTRAGCGQDALDLFCGLPEVSCAGQPSVCTMAYNCGNGVLDPGEQCDEGAASSDTMPDACRTSCVLPQCGDDVIDTVETCDDGEGNSDTVSGACRTNCLPASCGDGVVDPGEGCDEGTANSDEPGATCRTTCALATCGDGVLDAGEECDQGAANADVADACRTTCVSPSCGDAIVDSGEGCDDGASRSDTRADACRLSCQPASCGDRVVDTGEECDEGSSGSATCTSSCTDVEVQVDGGPQPDAGVARDAGVPRDAGITPDAGMVPDDFGLSGGACACTVQGGSRGTGATLVTLLIGLALVLRRRRR